MKKLYTWGGKFSNRNITVYDLVKNKGKKKYIQTTATNSDESSAAMEAGFDMILCKSPNISEVRKGAPDLFLTATIFILNCVDDSIKKFLKPVLIFWVIIFSYSRIYLGVHFPLDTLFGLGFGLISGNIFKYLYVYFKSQKEYSG